MMITYTPKKTRFGDCIHAVGSAILFAKKHNTKINFAPHEKIMDIGCVFKRRFAYDSFANALSLFNYENYLNITPTSKVGEKKRFHRVTNSFDELKYAWNTDFVLPNKICCAFNSRTTENKFKSKVNQTELAKLIRYLESKYTLFNCHEFGLVNSFELTIKEMLTCKYFIGPCSGWAHVAFALNMPVELMQMKLSDNKLNPWCKHFKYNLHAGSIDSIINSV